MHVPKLPKTRESKSNSTPFTALTTLRWRHNGSVGVSDQRPHDCLLSRSFRCRSKKTPKRHVTGLCAGNSSVTGEFPAQMASNAESISIAWRHRDNKSRRQTVPMVSIKLVYIYILQYQIYIIVYKFNQHNGQNSLSSWATKKIYKSRITGLVEWTGDQWINLTKFVPIVILYTIMTSMYIYCFSRSSYSLYEHMLVDKCKICSGTMQCYTRGDNDTVVG